MFSMSLDHSNFSFILLDLRRALNILKLFRSHRLVESKRPHCISSVDLEVIQQSRPLVTLLCNNECTLFLALHLCLAIL